LTLQAFLIVTVMAAAIGGGAWLFTYNRQLQKQRHFDRKIHARKLGWAYDGERDGRIDYRFTGAAGGIEWSMWYDSDRGDKSPTPKAYWKSTNVRTPHLSLVIIGRKRYQMESGAVGRILMDVVTGVAQAVSGSREIHSDKSAFYESALLLEDGPAAFRERYAVAVAPDMPRGWLDEQLRALLLKWPTPKHGAAYRGDEKIEVTLRPDGLQIVAQPMPEDFAFWNHLQQLGEALARKLGSLANH
jgi:hypothetical protein